MNADLIALVAKFPAPLGDRKLSDANKEQMDESIAAIVKLGPTAVVELVGMLVDPREGSDTQARHAIHALANHVAGQEDEHARREIALALASALGGDRPKEAKAFVIRQLQVCGGKEVLDALALQLGDEEVSPDAASAMLAIGAKGDAFRSAFASAKSKLHRLTLIQAMGAVRDDRAAIALREAADDPNADADVRQSSLWALANIGQADDVARSIAAADASGFARIQATDSCLRLAERLVASGKNDAAVKIYRHLRETRTDEEAYVREAAERGLAAMKSASPTDGGNDRSGKR